MKKQVKGLRYSKMMTLILLGFKCFLSALAQVLNYDVAFRSSPEIKIVSTANQSVGLQIARTDLGGNSIALVADVLKSLGELYSVIAKVCNFPELFASFFRRNLNLIPNLNWYWLALFPFCQGHAFFVREKIVGCIWFH